MRSFKFYTICLILLALIFTTPAYAKNYLFFAPDGTIGGTAGKLDNIDQCNADNAGYDLVDKDAAIVVDQAGGRALFYNYDGDSVTAESDPGVVAPDYCDEPGAFGAGRWILVDIQTSGGLLTTLFAAKADESIVGTSLNADDLVNTAGVLETVSTIPHTNVAETLTVAWDLAGSDADSVTGIPLDSDFGSNGIMVRTGAGTYGIGTTFDIPMGGEDYILMGEAGSPYNAEQIAPAAAIGALVDSVSGVIPTVMNYTEVTADNTLLTCAQMKNGIIYIKGAYNVILPDLATCNTTGMHGWITAWDADTITIEADADDNFTLNGTDLGDGDCATSDGTKGAFIEIFNPGLVSWRNLSQSNNPADGVSDWSDGGTCD